MYSYSKERPRLFTEESQKDFLALRDEVQRKIKLSGAVRLQEAVSGATGDSWLHLAIIDRLVELGEIREIEQEGAASQHRVFVRGPRWSER